MTFPRCHCARDFDSKVMWRNLKCGGIFGTPLSVILTIYKPYLLQEQQVTCWYWASGDCPLSSVLLFCRTALSQGILMKLSATFFPRHPCNTKRDWLCSPGLSELVIPYASGYDYWDIPYEDWCLVFRNVALYSLLPWRWRWAGYSEHIC
jgi:hypothetical protein